MKVLRAAVLMFALTMATGSAGAQGVLHQLMGMPGELTREEPKPCKPFETALEVRNVGAWSTLNSVPDSPPARPDLIEAAMHRLGGTRLVLAVDVEALRKEMLERARESIRGIVRDQRLGSPGAVAIRGDAIEFRARAGIDVTAVAKAFAPLTSGPAPLLVSRTVDDERAANSVVAFAVSDRAIDERRIFSRQIAIEKLERRLPMFGIEAVLIQPLDGDRILVVVPGLIRPDQLPEPLQMTAKVTFRIAERFANPCISAAMLPRIPKILMDAATKAPILVERRVIASGENLAEVAVVRDIRTGVSAVAFRFDLLGGSRLAKATQNNIEQGLAIVLDDEIIAMPTIREPIVHGTVLVSGGLTLEQAKQLAVLLRAGWLPPRLTVIEQQVVEPKPK